MNDRKCDNCGDVLEKSSVDPICYICVLDACLREAEEIKKFLDLNNLGLSE